MTPGAFSPATRRLIITRDEGACVACGRPCVDPDTGIPQVPFYSIQHRRARGMGGSRDPLTDSPANGVVLCGSAVNGCHGRVESQPVWASSQGLRIPQGADPRVVPVFHVNRGATVLTEAGTYAISELEVAP